MKRLWKDKQKIAARKGNWVAEDQGREGDFSERTFWNFKVLNCFNYYILKNRI